MRKRRLPLNIQLFGEGKEEEAKEPEQQEQEEAKPPAAKDESTKGAEKTATPEGEPETQPGQDPALLRELLEARAQVAAVKEGVLPYAVEDAVCLAVHAAEREGKLTQEAVTKALGDVMKRHPEWKRESQDHTAGGFRVGAESGAQGKAGDEQLAAIFGNNTK